VGLHAVIKIFEVQTEAVFKAVPEAKHSLEVARDQVADKGAGRDRSAWRQIEPVRSESGWDPHPRLLRLHLISPEDLAACREKSQPDMLATTFPSRPNHTTCILRIVAGLLAWRDFNCRPRRADQVDSREPTKGDVHLRHLRRVCNHGQTGWRRKERTRPGDSKNRFCQRLSLASRSDITPVEGLLDVEAIEDERTKGLILLHEVPIGVQGAVAVDVSSVCAPKCERVSS